MIDKSSFNELVARPYRFTISEKQEIQASLGQYPFCAPLHILNLVSSKACGTSEWKSPYNPSRLYTLMPKHLDTLIEIAMKVDAKPRPQNSPTAGSAVDTAASDEEPFDIFDAINSYQDVSFKTAPKSVILTNFLENGPTFDTKNIPENATPVEELAKKSIKPNNSLETETMAVIYEKQGKFEKAVEIYEKLMADNPEKSSTFANRISALKNKIENK